MDPESFEVKAAGGVVWRMGDDDCPQVALIHRPRYDDWSLPKGKLDPGESWEEAALREVEEEIGVRARLGDELPPSCYEDNQGRSKLVRYWLMEVAEDRGFEPSEEVDEIKWCAPGEASRCVTYQHDAELLVVVAEIIA